MHPECARDVFRGENVGRAAVGDQLAVQENHLVEKIGHRFDVVVRRDHEISAGGELADDARPVVVADPGGSLPVPVPAPTPVKLTQEEARKAEKEMEPVSTPVVADSEVLLDDVLFAFDSTAFLDPSEAQEKLQHLANVLHRHPDARLLIEGHTCDRGEERYNLVLSCYRANAVAAHLAHLGISRDRFITAGFGKSDPAKTVAPGDSAGLAEAKRIVNRRARLRLAAPQAMEPQPLH